MLARTTCAAQAKGKVTVAGAHGQALPRCPGQRVPLCLVPGGEHSSADADNNPDKACCIPYIVFHHVLMLDRN